MLLAGWISLACVVLSPAGGQTEVLRLSSRLTTPHSSSNWPNQLGGKLNGKKRDPSKIDNRCGVLHTSTGKTDVAALDHVHIWIPWFGYNESEYKGDIFWRSRQMHNFGGRDGLRWTFQNCYAGEWRALHSSNQHKFKYHFSTSMDTSYTAKRIISKYKSPENDLATSDDLGFIIK